MDVTETNGGDLRAHRAVGESMHSQRWRAAYRENTDLIWCETVSFESRLM